MSIEKICAEHGILSPKVQKKISQKNVMQFAKDIELMVISLNKKKEKEAVKLMEAFFDKAYKQKKYYDGLIINEQRLFYDFVRTKKFLKLCREF